MPDTIVFSEIDVQNSIFQMNNCFEKLDIITAANNRTVEQSIKLKDRLVRRNGEKSVLYEQKRNSKKDMI